MEYSIIPKNFVILTKIFLEISRQAAKNAKKNIVLHFASFAALRDNKICLQPSAALGIIVINCINPIFDFSFFIVIIMVGRFFFHH